MSKSGLEGYKLLLGYKDIPAFLLKYLDTPCLLRLKKVGYFCGMDYASKNIYQFQEYISRFDHSLTTSLMTWNFTKRKKDTIAALFHDVATPCFSHVIDYMNRDYIVQESTEEYTEQILRNSEYLKKCLKQDDIKIEDIIEFKKYSIVDNSRPKLCTDRLDGIILTGYGWIKEINYRDIKEILFQTEVYKNHQDEEEIGFKSKDTAKKIVEYNQHINQACHSLEDTYMMELLASITREVIHERLITYQQLFSLNEEEMIQILKNSSSKTLLTKLKMFFTIQKKDIPNIGNVQLKERTINPLVRGKRLF